MKSRDALIVVDIQNDFLPGGALAVPQGDRVMPVANSLMDQFNLVVATQDWHPANHGSFAAKHPGKNVGNWIDLNGVRQVLWPVHCVQGTRGAEFARGLRSEKFAKVFRKGTDRGMDSYSGLYDNGHRRCTGLGEFLRQRGVSEVFILGLATDYCVKFTALDAAGEGFKVHLVQDGCRGVELNGGDVAGAIEEMRRAGIELTRSEDLLAAK